MKTNFKDKKDKIKYDLVESPLNNKKSLNIILLLSLFILLSAVVFAIPNSLTLQGKLTNTAGAAQAGTFNFTFRIYDAATSGNVLYELANRNITTDANGIYDIILGQINLSFADQYYMGITVGSDNESSPRVNLTSAPYSFRANTSEALNPNASYVVTNLSVTGNATIGTGGTTLAISTLGFNLTAIGNIFIGKNLSVAGNTLFVDGLNEKVGIGTASLDAKLKVAGDLNTTGTVWALGVNLSTLSSSAAGWTDDGSVVRLSTVSDIVGIGTPTPLSTLHVNGTGASGGFRVTNDSGYTAFFVNATSGNVGIGTAGPSYLLDITTNASPATQLRIRNTYSTAGTVGGAHIQFENGVDASTIGIANSNRATYKTLTAGTTYIYSSNTAGIAIMSDNTAGSIRFTSGESSESMRIDSAGNVGIGTASPGRLLEVAGSINGTQLNISGPANLAYGSGFVGIGTTSPNDILEVVGNVRVSGSLNATNINASRFYARNGTVSAPAYTFIEDTNTGIMKTSEDNLTFVTGGSSRVTIDSSGNVGIGTASPDSALQVVGNIFAGADFTPSGTAGVMNILSSDTTVKPAMVIRSKDALDYGFDFDHEQTSRGELNIYSVVANARTLAMSISRETGKVGNVGIGTASPLQKLEISGNVLVNNTANAFLNLSGPILKKSGNDIVISD